MQLIVHYHQWAQRQWLVERFQAAETALDLIFALAQAEDSESPASVIQSIQALTSSLDPKIWKSFFAPLGAIEGCWLETVVEMANAHTPLGAVLLDLQKTVFDEALPRRNLYELGGFQANSGDFSWVSQIDSEREIWRQATLLLGLGQLGRSYLPEILGYTLTHARLVGGLFGLIDKPADREQVKHKTEEALELFKAAGGDLARAALGGRLYLRQTRSWIVAWNNHARQQRDLNAQVLKMLQTKAHYGKGLHQRVQLQGRSLESWLDELKQGRGQSFLKAFAESSYFDPADPDNSRFFCHSTTFDGPMFGVFTEAELALLKRWVASKSQKDTPFSARIEILCPKPNLPDPQNLSVSRHPRRAGQKRPGAALLYHHLLHWQAFPNSLPAAKEYVKRILRKASKKASKTNFPYSPAKLIQHIESLHQEACRDYPAPVAFPRFSRELYLWGMEQFAPAILVDGCWLQQSAALIRGNQPVGKILWSIFRDELGAGDAGRNHANVFRKLLADAEIQLPSFDSEAFIKHRGFVPGAFDLPAYLLAIGRSSEEFLPELLGLNLAIELSGLGKTYQWLAEEMEFWGFDPAILRLHQAIDNLASGHARWACDAVIAYLDQWSQAGQDSVQQQWLRVWRGYHSLAVACRRFSRHLVITGWLRFGIRRRFRRRK